MNFFVCKGQSFFSLEFSLIWCQIKTEGFDRSLRVAVWVTTRTNLPHLWRIERVLTAVFHNDRPSLTITTCENDSPLIGRGGADLLRVAKPWRLFESRLRLRAYFSNDGRYETSYKSPLIREIWDPTYTQKGESWTQISYIYSRVFALRAGLDTISKPPKKIMLSNHMAHSTHL